MATRKRLSFSSDGDGDGDISVSDIAKHYSILGDGDVSVSEIEKLDSMHAAAAAEEEELKKEKKKKKRKRKSKLIWSEEDELTVLKGLIDYGAKNPDFDWDKFYSFAKGCVKANVSEKQMISKIRKLKKNFLFHKKLIEQGNDPLFTRCSDSEAFGYASLLWTPNDELQSKKGGEETMNKNGAEQAKECRTGGEESRGDDDDDGELQAEKAEETLNADEQAGNGDEPVNENGAENRESLHEESRDGGDDDETFQADMQVDNADEPVNVNGAEQATECRTGGEESREEDDDECCWVRDALETQVLKGLSDDQKKFHLEKMMNNIGNELRKELSDEWKVLSAESVRLSIKKLRFRAMVAEVANDG